MLLIQALLVGFSTPWAERVNNTFVSLELVGMVALTVLLLIVAVVRGTVRRLESVQHGRHPRRGLLELRRLTTAGPWMLGFLLGAFTIVGFESAANLAEETNDPERVVPRAMWQAVLASGVLGFLFIVAVTLAAGDPVALAESGTPIADVIDKTPRLGGRHPAAADGGARDLRVRPGHHDDRRPADVGDVARRTLPWLAAVEPGLADVPHAAEGHRCCMSFSPN